MGQSTLATRDRGYNVLVLLMAVFFVSAALILMVSIY